MALPKVQESDIVEVAFHNHDKMHLDRGIIYTSAKKNNESEVNMECGVGFLLVGGEAHVKSFDRSSITLGARLSDCGDIIDDEDVEYVRIERKFIKSLEVECRFTVLDFGGDGIRVKIPEDATESVEVLQDEMLEDEYRPKLIREFLAEVKKRYYDTKVKAKPKKKKKPGAMKKGAKITRDNWRGGMKLDVTAIPWAKSDDDLDPINLHFVWNEGYFDVEVQFDTFGLNVYDSGSYTWRLIPDKLIASMVLSKAFTPTPDWREPDDEPDHVEFGDLVVMKDIGYQAMSFYDRGIEVGCKSFAVTDVKKLYRALCKVYGEPK